MFIQHNVLLCDSTILFKRQRLRCHHRLDNLSPLSEYNGEKLVAIIYISYLLRIIVAPGSLNYLNRHLCLVVKREFDN
jgi:hypothetical protein